MNARVLTGHAAIEARARELDVSFLRRVRAASLHELRLIARSHKMLGCESMVMNGHDFGCWKCALLERHK